VFDPPVAKEWSAEIWSSVVRHLLDRDGCDIASLGPVSETYKALEALKQTTLNCPLPGVLGALIERDVHTVYYLPKSIDDLLASIDSKERKVRRKKLRDLEAKGPLRIDVVKDAVRLEKEFPAFVQQHTSQWEAEGRPGHFHAWPRAREFHNELVKTMAKLQRVWLMNLFVGEQKIVGQYCFSFGKHLYAELPSRVIGPEWERLSLGCSSQVKLLEAAIAEGFETMESGLGHYEYKVLLGGREHRVVNARFQTNSSSSRLRTKACLAMRNLLVLASQKLWYQRISPHLPKVFRSGQSETAITFDF
jgi:CelD/BcsL family acetyltransferase involved in cellulose biosynthesis